MEPNDFDVQVGEVLVLDDDSVKFGFSYELGSGKKFMVVAFNNEKKSNDIVVIGFLADTILKLIKFLIIYNDDIQEILNSREKK